MVKVFTTNANGKIEFTKDELETLLNEVWNDGYDRHGTYWWTSPMTIDADALMADLEKWLKQIDPTHPPEDNAIPPMEDSIVSTLMTIEEQPTIEP